MANPIIFRANLLPKVILQHVQRRFMPVNVPPTATGKRRFRLAVETDPHKLVNYCCGLNYHIDQPPVKLKPDNEYPEWLWNLRLSPEPNSWEMERGTKEYYLKLAKEGRARNLLLKLKSERTKKTVDKSLLFTQDYLHHKRFAALAFLEDDVGLELNTLEDEYMNPDAIHASDYYLPVDNNRVLYQDKISTNLNVKNFSQEDNSFALYYKRVAPRPPGTKKATLDRRQRHRHSVF